MRKLISKLIMILVCASMFAFNIQQIKANDSISATVDIKHNALNLNQTQGRWVTAYIELPEPYDVNNITVSTITLNDTIPVDPSGPTSIGDYDIDGIPDLMVKFNRTEVVEYMLSQGATSGNITLTLKGQLEDLTPFEGSDEIAVSNKIGDVDCNGSVNIQDIVLACSIYDSQDEDASWNANANFAPPWDKINIFDIATMIPYYE